MPACPQSSQVQTPIGMVTCKQNAPQSFKKHKILTLLLRGQLPKGVSRINNKIYYCLLCSLQGVVSYMYYHRPNSAHIHFSALDIDQWLSLLWLTEDDDIPLPYLLQKIVNPGTEVKCQLDVDKMHEGLVSVSLANITRNHASVSELPWVHTTHLHSNNPMVNYQSTSAWCPSLPPVLWPHCCTKRTKSTSRICTSTHPACFTHSCLPRIK